MQRKKYKLLILTNHLTHTESNSFYGITNAMFRHPSCKSVDVVSVGTASNTLFLQGKSTRMKYIPVTSDFSYKKSKKLFTTPQKESELTDYNVIFLRVPHPVPERFLLFLEKSIDGKRIINRPSGLTEVNSKAFLLTLKKYCPPMKLCTSPKDILLFSKHFPIVLKPLYGHKGKGIVKVDKNLISANKEDKTSIHLLRSLEFPCLAVEFTRNVFRGDKRINVAFGKIICATNRVPPNGNWICNVALGGRDSPISVSNREREIVKDVSNILAKKGVFIFGIDTLIDNYGQRVLSEINVMSIGGLIQAEAATEKKILKRYASLFWKYVDTYLGG